MAETMEINETSTTEEVQQYVEKVVEEVKAERAPEAKTDAQIVNDTAEPTKTPVAEKKSGGEKPAKAVKAKAEKSGSEASSWIDDNLKAEVAAYGLEESELADFASREELDRALRLLDKTALEAGRKALADGADSAKAETTRNEKGQFVKKEEGAKAPEPKAEPEVKKDGRYEIQLDKDIYDEEIVGEFTRLRDHYESRLEALESRLFEQEAKSEEQHFDSLVDSLDHDDLFGKTGKEDATQLQRREDLLIQAKALMLGLAQMGRPTDLDEALVNRAARMLFAEDLSKKDLKNRTRKIAKQSNSRQGGGATRPQDPREDPRDKFDRMFKEMNAGS